MKDLKKLTRMQGGYFATAFLFLLAMGVFGLYALQYGDNPEAVHRNMMQEGFRELHFLLAQGLLFVLIIRTFFADGRGNREFLQTLPVKKKSWYLFDTFAGVVFILAMHLAMFFIYSWRIKLAAVQMVSLGKLFLDGMLLSIVEYHGFLLLGHLLEKAVGFFQKRYVKYLEEREEKTWAEYTKQRIKK